MAAQAGIRERNSILGDDRELRQRIPLLQPHHVAGRFFAGRAGDSVVVSGYHDVLRARPVRGDPEREPHAITDRQRRRPRSRRERHCHRRHVAGNRLVRHRDAPIGERCRHDARRRKGPRRRVLAAGSNRRTASRRGTHHEQHDH